MPPRLGDDVPRLPLLDLSSGYVQRALADFPAQGPSAPWRVRQNYTLDRLALRRHPVDDGVLRFGHVADLAGEPATTAAPRPSPHSPGGRPIA